MLDKRFASSYGFTQQEVDELLAKVPIVIDRAAIQHWYNGYTFGDKIIYNPWSIMCCLDNEGKLDHYWLDSGGTDLIDSVLLLDKRQEDLQKLIAGASLVRPITRQIIFQDLEQPRGLYSLLLFSGYLNPKVVDATGDTYQLSIPNYEVGHIYKTRILEWVLTKLDPDTYYTLPELLASGQVLEVETALRELLQSSTSFHQTGGKVAELFYSGFMLGLLSSLSSFYLIESERESGMGRPDAVLIPKAAHGDQALVIEYKVGQDVAGLPALAAEGLSQISAKGYSAQAKSHAHVKKLLQMCLAFCGKEVALKYEQVTL